MAASALASIRFVGLRRQRAGERHDVGRRQQLVQLVVAVDRIGAVAAAAGIAPDADDAHVERLGELGQPRADAAEADDQQRLAAELVLARGDLGDHAAPVLRRLVVAAGVQVALERQDQRHGVLGHRVRR